MLELGPKTARQWASHKQNGLFATVIFKEEEKSHLQTLATEAASAKSAAGIECRNEDRQRSASPTVAAPVMHVLSCGISSIAAFCASFHASSW